jgi:hypothetical protein
VLLTFGKFHEFYLSVKNDLPLLNKSWKFFPESGKIVSSRPTEILQTHQRGQNSLEQGAKTLERGAKTLQRGVKTLERGANS